MILSEQNQPFTVSADAAQRAVRIYAMIVALVFADPQLVAIPAITWLIRGLGLSCFALGGVLWLLSRSHAVGLAPLLAFAAGACTLALLGIGWGHLTLWGMLWLLLVAATDIGCGLWMRRLLREFKR